MDIDQKFEERADFLEKSNLVDWYINSNFHERLLEKTLGSGAKLFMGPRGVGKTHLFKYAYEKSFEQKEYPFVAYSSFGSYFHLEPLLTKSPHALRVFHNWVLAKIALSALESLERQSKASLKLGSCDLDEKSLIEFISFCEKGSSEERFSTLESSLTISNVKALLEHCTSVTGRGRAIVLLDDAALTLTPEYMVEFFDIFRNIKSAKISPKASVYPGSTEYGPRFHPGQDAELVNCWLSVDSSDYLGFMKNVFESRQFGKVELDVVSFLSYMSFGNPRALIVMTREFLDSEGKTLQSKLNQVLEAHANRLTKEYMSLGTKIPRYKSLIAGGKSLLDKSLTELAKSNTFATKKQVVLGLDDVDNILKERLLNFLVEAGIYYKLDPVKHGDNRVYERFIPHYTFLMLARAFASGRGFSLNKILHKIQLHNEKHPLRRKIGTLVNASEFKLDLPACQNCGASRLSDSQKYCHSCGSVLVAPSAYQACLSINISELPFSDWQKKKILKETKFRTLGDFLTSQNPVSELRKVNYIGPKRSQVILQNVQKVVEEFFS